MPALMSFVAGALCLSLPLTAHAADGFPSRSVSVINGFSPGGSIDASTRPVAAQLAAIWGSAVTVENRPGATGNLANEFVSRAAPDGHVLAATGNGSVVLNPLITKSPRFNPATALEPVILLGNAPNVLVVAVASPAKTLSDLLDLGRKNPGKLSYGSSGLGTTSHLTSALLMQRAGIEAVHVPYKGAAEALSDVATGRVDATFATIPTVIAMIRDGRLRPLAVSTSKRSPMLPEVPTVQQQGIKDFDAGAWIGLFAPKGTPANVIQKINADANRALKSPEVARAYDHQGVIVEGGTSQEFARLIADDIGRWRSVVQGLNLQ